MKPRALPSSGIRSEGDLWDYLRPRLEPYGRLKRIENALPSEAGTPDVYYNLRGYPGWLELKNLNSEPARPTSPIAIPHLTLDQVNWLEAEALMNGRATLFLRIGVRFLAFSATHVRNLYNRELTLRAARDVAIYHSINGIKPADLYRCLVRPTYAR